jgi:hypothetical protein
MQIGVNIVYFANLWQLIRCFILGWDFKSIAKILAKTKIKLMMLPIRGVNKISLKELPETLVIAYEPAWNYSKFFPAVLKLIKTFGNIRFLLSQGSKTGKEGTFSSQIDKLAGMNYGKSGTIFDWMLFGDKTQARISLKKLEKLYPKAIKTSHGLLSSPLTEVREIHPEMRAEYKLIKNQLKLGKKVECYPGLENELKLILESRDFLDYLYKSNLKFCIDVFHTFQRGSRDGRDSTPVVSQARWFEFLEFMKYKTPEVHFRLDKVEVEKIYNNDAESIRVFNIMAYIYSNYRADIIYEFYPDLFTSTKVKVERLIKVHNNLINAFSKSPYFWLR